MGKNLSAGAEDVRDMGSIPGLGRSPAEGNGYPLQYSCLENPMDRRAWGATAHGVTKNWTCLSHLAHIHANSWAYPYIIGRTERYLLVSQEKWCCLQHSLSPVRKHFYVPRLCFLKDVTAIVPNSLFLAQTCAGIFKVQWELCRKLWNVDDDHC